MKKVIIPILVILTVFIVILLFCYKKYEEVSLQKHSDATELLLKMENINPTEPNNSSGTSNNPDLLSFPSDRPSYKEIYFQDSSLEIVGSATWIEWVMEKEELEKISHIIIKRADEKGGKRVITKDEGTIEGSLVRYKILDLESWGNQKPLYYKVGVNENDGESYLFISQKVDVIKKPNLTFSNLCIWILSWFK